MLNVIIRKLPSLILVVKAAGASIFQGLLWIRIITERVEMESFLLLSNMKISLWTLN